ncbi:hypothetical protein F4703DRAFT_1769504 [Phycomyces blakesleeanus]
MATEHIYLSIKATRQTVTVKLGERSHKRTIDLEAHSYDPIHQVIEFKPDLALFHLLYNPALERTYELPSPASLLPSKQSPGDLHYVGDRGLILALSYQTKASPHHNLFNTAYSSHAIHMGVGVPAPRLEIHWVRATLAWVVSGMAPHTPVPQIYTERYASLDSKLAHSGCYKYDLYSNPVLEHIVQGNDQIPQDLLKYLQSHTHECHTRLSRIQHMLEGAGVDARVIWKYSFAKACVVSNGSLLGEEDVVRRIQVLEEEWRKKRQSLTRRLNATI